MGKNHSGGKSSGLYFLKELNYNVPEFFVLSHDFLNKIFQTDEFEKSSVSLSSDARVLNEFYTKAQKHIESIKIPEDVIDEIKTKCISTFSSSLMAVRSSAKAEDSAEYSFAGQYSSFLYVSPDALEDRIKKCFASQWNPNALMYMFLTYGKIIPQKMSVIIQKMINATVSGVVFTMDTGGNLNNLIISAAYGAGEGIVGGKVNADLFYFDRQSSNIYQKIAIKNTAFIYNPKVINNLSEASIEIEKANKPCLSREQIVFLSERALNAEKSFHKPLDIEFSIDAEGQVYFLQARPITTIYQDNLKILDNTNISESYPGITLPLSISFAKNNYYHVFKGTVNAVGVNINNFPNMEDVLSNLIAGVAGRVYYRLDNWYKTLSLVIPGKKSMQNWETSLGLKQGSFQPIKVSSIQKVKSKIRLAKLVLYHNKWSKKFFYSFSKDYNKLSSYNYREKKPKEVFTFIEDVSASLFDNWYPTLINDLIAFRSYGKLKKIIKSLGFEDDENIANDLLCGISDVESEKPLLTLLEMVDKVKNNSHLSEVFNTNDSLSIYSKLKTNADNNLLEDIYKYSEQYGDRTTSELKLETASFRNNPEKVIELIKSHLNSRISKEEIKQNQQKIRQRAEMLTNKKLNRYSLQKLYYNYILKLARNTIRNRENMRFCRTRAYGSVKELYAYIGVEMQKAGVILQKVDIYYLDIEHVKNFCLHNDTSNLESLIDNRKKEYDIYEKITLPDRIIYQAEHPPYNEEIVIDSTLENELKGIAVSKGTVLAKAIVVDEPDLTLNVHDSILVTKITDPGWIFLMSKAAGLISEKGSLLSHTAIVGRELGIPTIVGAEKATTLIHTGDVVFMDGSTGYIRIEK
ncbi:MAG: hypothetical protein KGZ97_04015 [Bacteroidetes bacterium]|nr:hypothetical protein [Bacteroidota bacterium]